MTLSFLLICLGGLLAATTISWSELSDRRSFNRRYEDAWAAKPGSSLYSKVTTIVSWVVTFAGIYLLLKGR